MSPKHLLLLPPLVLLLYLGVYSWNQRTHTLDDIVSNTGLEVAGTVLKSMRQVQDQVMGAWDHYLDLVGVREDNLRLTKELETARLQLARAAEDRVELLRLRRLLTLTPPDGWQTLGARVRAGRIGPNAALATLMIGRGYLTGALPGTPVMRPEGVVGRILRAGPSTATVLLLYDPGSRIAVIGQESRAQGILVGMGQGKPLEVRFVEHNVPVRVGETLVTSGLDGSFPQGLPVARVTASEPSDLSSFQLVRAEPLSSLAGFEELLLVSTFPERPEAIEEPPAPAPEKKTQRRSRK